MASSADALPAMELLYGSSGEAALLPADTVRELPQLVQVGWLDRVDGCRRCGGVAGPGRGGLSPTACVPAGGLLARYTRAVMNLCWVRYSLALAWISGCQDVPLRPSPLAATQPFGPHCKRAAPLPAARPPVPPLGGPGRRGPPGPPLAAVRRAGGLPGPAPPGPGRRAQRAGGQPGHRG